MKIAAIILFSVLAFFSKADESLKSVVEQVDTATIPETFIRLAKISERLAEEQTNQWLAYYWGAFNYTTAAYLSPRVKKDELLDKAQSLIDRSHQSNSNNVELLLLQSWVYATRIAVAPGGRAKDFAQRSEKVRELAYQKDPQNPRYYFLKGAAFFYTPPGLGGGKEKAKPILEQAIKKHKSYPVKSNLHPKWGVQQSENLLEQCK